MKECSAGQFRRTGPKNGQCAYKRPAKVTHIKMGNRLHSNSATTLEESVAYQDQVTLKIKKTGYFGRRSGSRRVSCRVPPPIADASQLIQVGNAAARVSGSILPTFDPLGRAAKPCQDSFFLANHSDALLVGVFDGHGAEGKPVARFCCAFMKTHFKTWLPRLRSSPVRSLETLVLQCETALCLSGIDVLLSGATAVLAFLVGTTAYVATVGDSRAVLAAPSTAFPGQPTKPKNPYVRRALPPTPVEAVALTTDQRPNDPAERQRILASGGQVMPLVDQSGKLVGPHRVWGQTKNLPGLAVSRSLGNEAGKRCGVIAKPVVTQHSLEEGQIVVLATAGLWTAMSSQEAVDFAETVRMKASSQSTCTYPATVRLYSG